MGERPKGIKNGRALFEIDRTDNEGDYCPENCRWIKKRQNSLNARRSRIWTVNGVDYPSAIDAANAVGLPRKTLSNRCTGYGNFEGVPTPGYSVRDRYPQ